MFSISLGWEKARSRVIEIEHLSSRVSPTKEMLWEKIKQWS